MLGFHFGAVSAPEADDCHDTEHWLQLVNRASLVANVEGGLLDPELARRIRAALDEMRAESLEPGAPRCDLYIQFEPRLLEKCGVEASVLHAGRSSQDILAAANAGLNIERLVMAGRAVLDVCEALLELAEREGDAIVPAYTNGVQAQPTLYGHHALAHVQVFIRDAERLRECMRRHDVSPMGSCVCNGTGWPLDPARMAGLLGFAAPYANAFDAGQCRGNDLPLEMSQIVTSMMLHVNAFLADFMVQYAQVRPWIVSVSGNGVYKSSAMPQKRNPGLVNDCRRDAGLVIGEAQGVLMRLQNLQLGMADARDEHMMRELMNDAATVLGTFAQIVRSLRVDRERALEEVNAEWTCTQEVADTLMREAGIDFRTGHRFASEFVTHARSRGLTPRTVGWSDFRTVWERFAEGTDLPAEFPLSSEQLMHAVDPACILRGRRTPGSASPCMMEAQLEAARGLVSSERVLLKCAADARREAHERLEALVQAL